MHLHCISKLGMHLHCINKAVDITYLSRSCRSKRKLEEALAAWAAWHAIAIGTGPAADASLLINISSVGLPLVVEHHCLTRYPSALPFFPC